MELCNCNSAFDSVEFACSIIFIKSSILHRVHWKQLHCTVLYCVHMVVVYDTRPQALVMCGMHRKTEIS